MKKYFAVNINLLCIAIMVVLPDLKLKFDLYISFIVFIF